MIINDDKIIKDALSGEDFYLPKNQILNTSIKINSNRNLNINSHIDICNYKLKCFDNLFDEFEIYFSSIFKSINSKEKIFNLIKGTSNKKIKFKSELDDSIETIKYFYKNFSLKEEIFNTHILDKESINFGKISNFFNSKILSENISTYKEIQELSSYQNSYFEVFNKQLMSDENFKKYFLIDIQKIYDKTTESINIENININTYICQNLINVTRSLFTLHSGSLEDINTTEYINISEKDKNLICVTTENKDLDFFKYNNSNSMSFDYDMFYKNDYLTFLNRENYTNLTNYNEDAIERNISNSSSYRENSELNNSINTSRSFNINNSLVSIPEKKMNVSYDTFEIVDNGIRNNSNKTLKIYEEFYVSSASLNNEGVLINAIQTPDSIVPYANSLKQIYKSLYDIYSLDMNEVNIYNNIFLNKWIFSQSNIRGNESFSSDISFKDNNLYNSINFSSIASKYLETYNSRNNLNIESSEIRHIYYEEEKESILKSVNENYLDIEDYESNKEEIFYSTLDSRFKNIESSWYNSFSLDVLSYNLKNNPSMLYYKGRPVYEINYPNFVSSEYSFENLTNNQNNNYDYTVWDKDLVNASIEKGANYFSLKLDSIVKKIKFISLNNSEVETSLFKEISKTISDKETKFKIISYSNDIKSDIVLAKENNKAFNLLFTADESDKKFYSNFSITHKEKLETEYSNYLNLIKINQNNQEEIENNINNIRSLISNYYKGRYFKTSSVLLKNIISDVIKEAKNISSIENYDEIVICQYLYLFYLKSRSLNKNNQDNSYDLISKRFIKKSIEKSRQYTGKKSLKEFKFSTENISNSEFSIDISDDATTKRKNKFNYKNLFLEKYFKSSDSLKKIKETVFGFDNLNSIKNSLSIEKIQNVKINLIAQEAFNSLTESIFYDNELEYFENTADSLETRQSLIEELKGQAYNIVLDKLESSFENSKIEIGFDLTKCVLPFKYIFKNCTLSKENTQVLDETFHDILIENIDPLKYSSNSSLPLIRNTYKEGKISLKCKLKSKNSKTSTSSIVIYDEFEEIFENNSANNTVFTSIIEKINDMLAITDKEFLNREFVEESDIDEYISQNTYLIDLVTEVLEVYSYIYCFYIEYLNQETTLRLLSYNSIDEDSLLKDMKNSDNNLFLFDIDFFKNNIEENKTWCNDLLNEDISKSSIIELERLYNYYSENIQDFIGSDDRIISENKLKFTRQLEKSFRVLTTSDMYQSISFDLLMQNFNFYTNNMKNIVYSDLLKSLNVSNNKFNVESLIDNIFDKNYINALYNRNNFLNNYNALFNEKTNDLQDINSVLGINLFDTEKERETRKAIKLNINSPSKAEINSDLYSYIVNTNDLKNVNYDSLIKIKIEIIDHSRLDRIFLPKVLYFSPILFLDDYSNELNNNKIGLYSVVEDNNKKLEYYTLEELKKLQLFRNIIKQKFSLDNIDIESVSNDEKYDLIIESIYNNHVKSNIFENFIEVFYNIKIDEKQIYNNISIDTYEFFKNDINENTFFDIFSTNKNDFINNSFIFNQQFQNYSIVNKDKKYNKIIMFIKYLDNIISNENDISIMSKIENYFNINFNILTNEFIFILNNKDESLESLDVNTFKINGNDIFNIDKIMYYIEDIDFQGLVSYGAYRFGINENIDNYSISITSEVV